ncbi:nurim-like [Acanthaster planci]|uniref:Nuclear envelope membrane protein n=1 Tax=Acanthaster planci TaxID=133434 RepID=A0A8B7XQ56_ACAPL|nr:nurim-like [Acanthaster planci]
MAGATFLPKAVLFVAISAFGLCVCFLTVFQFGMFLFREGLAMGVVDGRQSAHDKDAADPYVSDLLLDLLLIAAFVLQHSLLARRPWKDFIQWLGLDVVERSLYILATCGALQTLMQYWRPLFPESVLWALDTDSRWVWTVLGILSFLGWLCVVGVVMVLDYAELVGIKQVYYFLMDLDPPLQMKSREYQRLFQNFRHPVMTGLLIILWAVPVMTMGRLVLALSLTIYTFYGHSLDMRDYDYICQQHQLKKRTLRSPQGFRATGGRASSVGYG